MRIVVAPDKFRGTLTAAEAAEAIARGARRVFPGASFSLRPVADGGEGTLDALLVGIGGRTTTIDVISPMGNDIEAPVALLDDGRTAVEMAMTSGLALVPPDRLDPLAATSTGTGEAIREALERSPIASTIVGVGGSATTDGGTGAARAIGWRFLDDRGGDLEPGGGPLRRLRRIDGDAVRLVEGARITAACDVANPLLGERGAARTYAPQKGADDSQVEILEEGLATLAERIHSDVGVDVAALSGAGAAGGMGAAVVAFFRGEIAPGFETVAAAIGLEETMRGADLVITGEGSLDEQTLAGKAPVGVARLARAAKIPCLAVAGRVLVEGPKLRAHGIKRAISLEDVDAGADHASRVATATRALLKREVETEGSSRRRRFL